MIDNVENTNNLRKNKVDYIVEKRIKEDKVYTKWENKIYSITSNVEEDFKIFKELTSQWNDIEEKINVIYYSNFDNDFRLHFAKEYDNDIMDKKYKLMIINGFYPYSLINSGTPIRNVTQIKRMVIKDLPSIKKELKKELSDHKCYINEIFRLYNTKKYRLCILDIIQFISCLFHKYFEIDFTEIYDNSSVRKSNLKKYFTNIELTYWIFRVYILDDNVKSKDRKNPVLVNEHNTNKYVGKVYNRNSILHGYSLDFGTKINCLRWITVLMNTCDLITCYKMSISNGGDSNETKI